MMMKARARRGLTQSVLAELIGCSAAHVRHLEHGRRCPGLALAMRVRASLGIPLAAWEMMAGRRKRAVPDKATGKAVRR